MTYAEKRWYDYFCQRDSRLKTETQEWRNWQTRRLQVPVVAISCGFKSRFLHGKSQALQNFAAPFVWRLRYTDARLKKQLTCGGKSGNIHSCSGKPLRAETQEWRNWQTRRLQVPVVAISCGFKSRFLHFKFYRGKCERPRKSVFIRIPRPFSCWKI